MLVSVPVQTDYTWYPVDEYHGDSAYVFRRNGWDIIQKFKQQGFLVSVLVPPEHASLSPDNRPLDTALVLDNIRYADKFATYYERFKELFYPACSPEVSEQLSFSKIWGQLEAFVASKPGVDIPH